LEFLAIAERQEQEIREMQIGKEEAKLSLFANDSILHTKDTRLHQETPRYHNNFSKLAGYKNNLQKSLVFLYTNSEQIEKEYRKAIPFTIASKN
jgi:hypothetical protein